jgi:hypothetical protein
LRAGCVGAGEGGSGLEVEAVAELGLDDLVASGAASLDRLPIPSASVRVDNPT